MPAIAVLAAAAAACCFLQVESRHLDAFARGAGLNNGNFLDNDQWLSTVSQYDRDKYWNRFRDRKFKENFEGLMLLSVTSGPGLPYLQEEEEA
ncbi:Testican-1 [Fukomys damarensis]|uniref:Testican-1 n=1 Tax=Fukomys damarensis TaxID=885580 RepID=A0A091CPT1_FUKDA|nr:Testican-1 [Fukomys damarensis]